MMNKRIKKKWLAALRSGEYAKGQDTMCAVNIDGEHQFCCLGVLANIYCEEKGESFDDLFGHPPYDDAADFDTELLPHIVQKWSGVNHEKTQQKLAVLNDHNETFEKPASYIEKRL